MNKLEIVFKNRNFHKKLSIPIPISKNSWILLILDYDSD